MSPLIASSLINKAASWRFLSLIGNRLAESKQMLPEPWGLPLAVQSLPVPRDGQRAFRADSSTRMGLVGTEVWDCTGRVGVPSPGGVTWMGTRCGAG